MIMTSVKLKDSVIILDVIVFTLFFVRGLLQLGMALEVVPHIVITAYGVLLLSLFLFFFIRTRFVFYLPKSLSWYLLFLGYGLFQIVYSGFSLKGVNDILSYFTYFLVAVYFFCQGDVSRKGKIRLFLFCFFFFLFIQIFYVVVLGFGHRGLLGSVLGHANSANLLMAFMVVYFASLRKWAFVAGLLGLMVIVGGRTSLISASIVAVTIFISNFIGPKYLKKLIVYFSLFFGFAFFTFLIFKGAAADWGDSIGLSFIGGDKARLISLNSLKWRVIHWGYYLNDLSIPKQIILGNGAGAHALVSPPIYGQFYEVHNDFLKIFYDFGLIGFSLFLLADIGMGRFFLNKYNGNHHLILYLYYIRYTYMLFDNMVTNFIGIFIFVFFVFILSQKELLHERKFCYNRQYRMGVSETETSIPC